MNARPTIRDAVRIGVEIEALSGCRVAMNHAWLTALPTSVAVKHLAAQGGDVLLIRKLTDGFTWKNSWALGEAVEEGRP